MEIQHDPGVKVEMDIADFSGKTVQRIDIQNVVDRADSRKAGVTLMMSFTDGSTGTIIILSREGPVLVAPYERPRMGHYSVIEEDGLVQVP